MRNTLRLLSLAVALCLLSASAHAQFYFGKNKIQYTPFDWKILTTDHFRIYFYEEEEELAKIAAAAAEDSYAELSSKFNHCIFHKVPLIIYSTPTFFSETNVTPSLIPENVAGFTEFFKGRMVIPFNGSIADFQRVIKHEMVHTFQFDKIPSVMSEHRKTTQYGPPLWFVEGNAEFWSRPWDSEAEMVMADMTLEGNIRPISELYSLSGTFFMYKYGESFLHYLADTYGEDKIQMLYENWWKARTFRELFKLTVGKSLEDVGKEWVYYLKKRHFPKLKQMDMPAKVTEPLTKQVFAVHPVPLRCEYKGTNDWIIYKANKLGYTGIYMRSPSTGEEITLIKGERSTDYESLHLLQSGIDVTNDGRVAFIGKRHEHDVLYIYDVKSGNVIKRFEFPSLYRLQSPSWSSDAESIVLSGAPYSGFHDLYLFHVSDSSLVRLTNDVYNDVDASFDTDGNIIFASDRGSYGYQGYTNLFKFDLSSRAIKPLTFGGYNDRAPRATSEGILFSSDRGGTSNIHLMKADGSIYRVTNYATGAFTPRLFDDKLIFSGYQDFTFSIYETPFDSTSLVPVKSEPPLFTAWNPREIEGKREHGVVNYSNEYSLDIAQSAVSYDAVFGTMGGLQVVLSDMLGNHTWYFLLANTASQRNDLLKSFNVGATYFNQEHRVNYGIGAYHLFNEYQDRVEGYYTERQTGINGLVSYPISKFTRVETSMFLRHSFRDNPLFQKQRHAILSTNYASLVHDNSIWDISGPIDGMRSNFTVGLTTDFYTGRVFNRLAFIDFRNYLRIRKYSAFATRIFGFASAGLEPQRIYLGGSWSLRGYDWRQFYGRKVYLISNELRFPLIDNLFIGFPFGRVGFHAIRGALFFDVGSAWDDEYEATYGSFGAGARVALGYLAVLRFDLSKKTTNFNRYEPGLDFDFFFGWNF